MSSLRDETGFRSSYAAKSEHFVVGLMSGTSLDGIDATLVRILTAPDGRVSAVNLLAKSYLPYSDALRRQIDALCSPLTARIDELTYLHFALGEWYAKSVSMLLETSGWTAAAVDAISMHGQTVWHAPQPRSYPGPDGELQIKGTLQLGSAAVLRERTGISVISDLRSRDMAAGGEGAPLAPYIDAVLFGSTTEGRIVQNIGGIGNATVVPAGAENEDVFAFDTGPGNMVIDAVVAEGSGGKERFDDGGTLAAKGRVDEGLVARLMRDPYFSREPPKSTGREVYGIEFSRAFIEEAKAARLGFEDRVATATAFTATSIASAYKDFILPHTAIGKVVAAGGGARNATLLRMISGLLPEGIEVVPSASLGIPDEAREPMAFAVLGHESLMGRPSNLPAVTGARAPVVLGSITL